MINRKRPKLLPVNSTPPWSLKMNIVSIVSFVFLLTTTGFSTIVGADELQEKGKKILHRNTIIPKTSTCIIRYRWEIYTIDRQNINLCLNLS